MPVLHDAALSFLGKQGSGTFTGYKVLITNDRVAFKIGSGLFGRGRLSTHLLITPAPLSYQLQASQRGVLLGPHS